MNLNTLCKEQMKIIILKKIEKISDLVEFAMLDKTSREGGVKCSFVKKFT